MKVQKIPFEEFKTIYSKVPRLCVEVVLIDQGKILLIRRAIEPAKGQWHTPGGTVLKGESLNDTVLRVAKEELGIEVTVLKDIGFIEYTSHTNHYSQDISIAFLVKTEDIKNIKIDANADAYDFFSKIPENTITEQKEFYKILL